MGSAINAQSELWTRKVEKDAFMTQLEDGNNRLV
jgi:hypothetical protein